VSQSPRIAALQRPDRYWEDRARRFAGDGEGLAAVCSYGMPRFYNRSIQFVQRLALARWLRSEPGSSALDVGCGVGRWSRMLAHQGAIVTGVDLSPTMIAEARRRAIDEGLGERCRFAQGDLATLDTGERYALVVGVTVLQHILDRERLRAAIARLAAHLACGGRMVLLEAAPTRRQTRCDSPIFVARDLETYLALFADCGLEPRAITGVDPAPFKTLLLPLYARLPRPLAVAALALATTLGAPIDILFGRRAVQSSWHKVFVLEHAGGRRNAG